MMMTNGDIYDIPYHNRVDMYIEVIRLTYEYDLRFPEITASSQAADTGTRKDADAAMKKEKRTPSKTRTLKKKMLTPRNIVRRVRTIMRTRRQKMRARRKARRPK